MKRIEVLDFWRSLAILIMVFYHAMYDLMLFGVTDGAFFDSAAARVLEVFGAGSFILISGIVARYSKDCVKRGFVVFCAGLLVAIATSLVNLPVAFGILQLLGVSMILYGLFKEKLAIMSGIWFPICYIILFFVTAWLTKNVTVDIKLLYPLGFKYEGFYSADYYPLFPWLFLFLLGTWLGALIDKHRSARVWSIKFPAPLTFAGRHSLLIYLLHQPVLYGLCLLFFGE